MKLKMHAVPKIQMLLVSAWFAPQAIAEERLLLKDPILSGEDIYIDLDSIKELTPGIYAARHFISMYEPETYLEITNSEYEMIGRQEIGTHQSIAYDEKIDCNQNLTSLESVTYYQGIRPIKGEEVYKESYDEYFDLPLFP